MGEIKTFLLRLTVLALMLFLIFGVVFGMMPMRNNDMMPRISAGDLLLYYRLGDTYDNQDVVVFRKAEDKNTYAGKKDHRRQHDRYVGRIVARSGDIVEITKDSQLKVNGSIVAENDIYYKTPSYEEGISYPVELKKDQYFVLGDFREGAKDSRYLGAVDAKEIKGEVITVIRRSGL